MANSIRIKRTDTSGRVPATLPYGELAVNVPDKTLYVGNNSGAPVALTGAIKGLRAHGHYRIQQSTGNIMTVHQSGATLTRLSAGLYRITVTSGAAGDTLVAVVGDLFSVHHMSGTGDTSFTIKTRSLNMLGMPAADPPEISIIVAAG